jgi:hypothetical protein
MVRITLFRKKPKILDGILNFEEPTIDCRLEELNALLEDGYTPILKFPIPDPINLNVIAVFILYKPDTS